MTIDLYLCRMFALHLLEPIPMSQQLEVLPRPEQQDRDQKEPDSGGSPHLPVPLAIDFTNDGVVADVLLDGVFERVPRHVCLIQRPRSATRSFALRARGFRSTSASLGTTGRFVRIVRPMSPVVCSERSVCFTMRSSREWKAITAIRPPGRRRRAACVRKTSRPSSSRFTQMRTA